MSGSYGSVRATLLHLVCVQSWWLSVLKGKPDTTPPPEEMALG